MSYLQYLRIVTCYVTSYLRKNYSVDNRKKTFDMSTKLPLLSRILNECLRVVASCDELFTVTSELFTDACDIDYVLAIRKDS